MKIKFTILLFLFPLSVISSPMDVMNRFYGNYKVVDAQRYSGGLTSDADSKLKIGMIYSVCPNAFKGLSGSLYQPLYKYSSIPYVFEDGVVESKNYLRDPHKLLPHIIHTLSDRPVSSTTELSTAKFALALADNIAYLY